MSAPLPSLSDAGRRARLVARHQLAGDAAGAAETAAAVVVLHATDPATVYLSVLARCASAALGDVSQALYDERSLVRLLAMRRTLFVVPRALVPVVHFGAALEIAAFVRKRLITQLTTLPTEPPVPAEVVAWLAEVEAGGRAGAGPARGGHGRAAFGGGAAAADVVPADDGQGVRRQTQHHHAGADHDGRRGSDGAGATTRRLDLPAPHLGVGAALVAGRSPGADPAEARIRLVEEYLRRFGPATEADVAWWTGWSLRQTRTAIAGAATTPSP